MLQQRASGVAQKSGNVFVKNLDPLVDNGTLYAVFAAHGRVLSCKVATDADGCSKGYGFVQFADEVAAFRAIEDVNGTMVAGKQIYVGPFVRRQDRTQTGRFCNVYVKNLADGITEEVLRQEFKVAGPVNSAVVMKDAEGHCKGFGFVNFESAEHATKAVEMLNGHVHEGKAWAVSRAQRKSEREAETRAKQDKERKDKNDRFAECNLYVKNLGDEDHDDRFRALFKCFGIILSSKVLRDQSGNSKGVGFVQFSNMNEAEAAIDGMNSRLVGDRKLYVALAQKEQDRQKLKPRIGSCFKGGLMGFNGVNTTSGMTGMVSPAMTFYPPGPQQPVLFPPGMVPPGAYAGMPRMFHTMAPPMPAFYVVPYMPTRPFMRPLGPASPSRGYLTGAANAVHPGTGPSQINQRPQDQVPPIQHSAQRSTTLSSSPSMDSLTDELQGLSMDHRTSPLGD